MSTPTAITAYLLLFALVGVLFVFVNLLIGWLIRPKLPNEEKGEVYECGEPTIGSSFVQFDLRFYVVALLFIIFDVEVAFFFPWGTVFGKSVQLMDERVPVVEVVEGEERLSPVVAARLYELGVSNPVVEPISSEEALAAGIGQSSVVRSEYALRRSARQLAVTSFVDIGVFFGVLMVGFAYVWKRGDLDWVRAVTQERATVTRRAPQVVREGEHEVVISV